MSLGQLHKILEGTNARAFGAIHGDGLLMNYGRR